MQSSPDSRKYLPENAATVGVPRSLCYLVAFLALRVSQNDNVTLMAVSDLGTADTEH